MIRRQLTSTKERLGTSLIREPSHVDGIVHHVAVQTDPVATRTEPDGSHAEVDVRGESPVQANSSSQLR